MLGGVVRKVVGAPSRSLTSFLRNTTAPPLHEVGRGYGCLFYPGSFCGTARFVWRGMLGAAGGGSGCGQGPFFRTMLDQPRSPGPLALVQAAGCSLHFSSLRGMVTAMTEVQASAECVRGGGRKWRWGGLCGVRSMPL